MTHKKLCFSLLILVFSLVLGWPTCSQAAQTTVPLIVSIGGDGYYQNEFYAWTGPGKALEDLTHYGWNGSPIISPNNRYIAYLSMPEVLKDAWLKYQWGMAGV